MLNPLIQALAFAIMFSQSSVRALSQSSAHRSTSKNFPSIASFLRDERNQKAIQIMPPELLLRLKANPSPETEFESYQQALVATSQWFNEFVANQMKTPTSEAAYTTELLDIYDAMVWRYNSPFLWRIQQEEVQDLYDACLGPSKAHCEIAVGTGLFLSNLQQTSATEPGLCDLTLLDLQPTALEACQKRLLENEYYNKHVQMDLQLANILEEPPSALQGSFDSVAANFLIHCLPKEHLGSDDVISTTFRHCASLLRPTTKDAVFFGSTILGKYLLQDQENAGLASVDTLIDYNRAGVFGNDNHSFEDVSAALENVFQNVQAWRIGYCAVWRATSPRQQ